MTATFDPGQGDYRALALFTGRVWLIEVSGGMVERETPLLPTAWYMALDFAQINYSPGYGLYHEDMTYLLHELPEPRPFLTGERVLAYQRPGDAAITVLEDFGDYRLMSTEQVAAQLSISTGRVRQLARARGVGRMVGRGRLFTADDVEILRRRCTTPGPARA